MAIQRFSPEGEIQKFTLADLMQALGRPSHKRETRYLNGELAIAEIGWNRLGGYSLTIRLDEDGYWQCQFFCNTNIDGRATTRRERLEDASTEMLEAWITLNASAFIENINR